MNDTEPILCPGCGKPSAAGDKRFRPFCSQRCQLADLGDWFSERFAIPDDGDPPEPGPRTQ